MRRAEENQLLRDKNLSMKERIIKQHLVAAEHARMHGQADPNADPNAAAATAAAAPGPSPLAPRHSSPLHTEIARLGLQMYLHMLIEDNFVHSDLHPGNLLVSFPRHGPLHGEQEPPQHFDSMSSEHLRSEHVTLVVMDSGLVSTLSPRNRRNFLSLFGALILVSQRTERERIIQHGRLLERVALKVLSHSSLFRSSVLDFACVFSFLVA